MTQKEIVQPDKEVIMDKLHVLPNGNGIQLRRVIAVNYYGSFSSHGHTSQAKVKIEYAGHTFLLDNIKDNIAVSWVEFDTDEAAIQFRDEFIVLVNSQPEKQNG